jgi:hypothetical protein
MLENTVKRTLKKLGHTTESAANTKTGFKLKCKSPRLGVKKIKEGRGRTLLLLGQSDVGRSFDSLVNSVVAQPPWPTTMTMTSLSLYAGYANRAISDITKNIPF